MDTTLPRFLTAVSLAAIAYWLASYTYAALVVVNLDDHFKTWRPPEWVVDLVPLLECLPATIGGAVAGWIASQIPTRSAISVILVLMVVTYFKGGSHEREVFWSLWWAGHALKTSLLIVLSSVAAAHYRRASNKSLQRTA